MDRQARLNNRRTAQAARRLRELVRIEAGARSRQPKQRSPPPWLREIGQVASAAVLDAAKLTELPGEDRRDEAVEHVAKWIDGVLTWDWAGPFCLILELVDGFLAHLIANIAVETAYRGMKDSKPKPRKKKPAEKPGTKSVTAEPKKG